MKHKQDLSRRIFLRNAGLSGIALTIGCYWPVLGKSIGEIIHAGDADNAATELMSWI